MTDDSIEARAAREASAYNSGAIERKKLTSWLEAGILATRQERYADMLAALGDVPTLKVLEIGSHGHSIFQRTGQWPKELHCINISTAEIEGGRASVADMPPEKRPIFHVMDAHKLDFPDGTFDAVYGYGILHHLDLDLAAGEIRRVLKPGGRMAFEEPFDMNPVATLVRRLTPRARTVDETPFRLRHLRTLRRYFTMDFRAYELLAVGASAVSRLVSPRRPLPSLVAPFTVIDRALSKVPGVRLMFRYALIRGVRRV